MSKVKKGKRVVAAAMAVALSVATVTTGVVPSSGVFVRAAEDESTYTKVADSSVDGFYYREDQYGNTQFVVSGLAKEDSIKSWTSSNKKIVNVSGNKNGACTIKAGNKTGKAKITITLASELKKTINVTVQKNAVACTSIKNVPKKLTLNRKKSYQLKPVINPITCIDKIKYKTSNKKVATSNIKWEDHSSKERNGKNHSYCG